MELIKSVWTKDDIVEFHLFEQSFKGADRDCEWEQRIVNTKLDCYGKTSSKVKDVVKSVKKGNFISFLDNLDIQTHFDSLCYAFMLPAIKDFTTFKNHLDKYVLTIDNWASCDSLKFDKYKAESIYYLANEYLKSDKEFVKRVGLNCYMQLIKNEDYFDFSFKVLDSLKEEKQYYVNMAAAWLLFECFTINSKKTIEYFRNNNTNDFIINKGIQKCRDSFRISQEDKDYILRFKKNNIK